MPGALEGVKILDLSRVLAGPYCTMILGDMGANVIKVEAPGGSDDTREWGPPYKEGESAYYFCANRNKRAITVNLKSEKGREIIKSIACEADVVIHNFRNGKMQEWGLDYPDLKAVNPKLVFCSITGFGTTGPYQNLAGYDYIIQGMAGLMGITGNEESGPTKVGVAIADVLTGLYAVIGILGALNERNRSGMGQHLDLSLFDAQISALVNVASNYLVSGKVPQRLGNLHPNIVPYQTFNTSDGAMVIAVGNDGQFKRYCSAIDRKELAQDERFDTNSKRVENRATLVPILVEIMKTKTSREWLGLFNEVGIPCGPINDMEQLFSEEQVMAREMRIEVDHPKAGKIPLVGSPLKFSRTPIQIDRHPPLAGEHTKEILLELGWSAADIEQLRDEEII